MIISKKTPHTWLMKGTFGIAIVIIAFSLNACKSSNDEVYDARIQENEILRPQAKKSPRINGPKVAGARPGKKFIYRIPCQGERPIKFSVDGLTDGLVLDSNKGIITGIVPSEKGEYDMIFSSTNAHGEATRSFKLIVGDEIALTPPTGWNSWGGQMIFISDEIVRKTADIFVEQGLADVGFQYIGIDDCWMKLSPELYANRRDKVVKMFEGFSYEGAIGEIRDSKGNIIPNESFPDMKSMTDYVHSYGLKAGIYSSPGITTCQDYAGSFGYQQQDARQYARWGFDLLKYDLCGGREELKAIRADNPEYHQREYWKPMTTYLKEQDRDIFFNLCQYGREEPWTWAPELGIQSWRIGGDLNHNVSNYFKEAMRMAKDLREFSGPGHWNDPDFMYIHKLRDVWNKTDPSKEISLNTNQRYQYVSLWSIVCAPFFFSSDILEMDDFTFGLLTNADILNINQDELTHVAEVIRENEHETVMIKKLADGSKVLALFNRNTQKESVIKVSWSEVSENGKLKVYDVWRQKELGYYEDEMLVKLSPDGVGLFIVE